MKKQSEQQTTQTEDSCNPSAAEARRKLQKEFLFEFVKTVVFALAAATTLVSGSIAWFAANTGVHSQTSSISPMKDAIRLATTGQRQTVEVQYLKANGKNVLEDGTQFEYMGKPYFRTESNQIALRLSEDYIISPGTSGSVTFYILPNRDGDATVTLYLGLTGYALDEENAVAERVNDDTLDALLSGHILLFQNKDENGHYSDWLFRQGGTGAMNNSLTVTLPADAQKDVPYPVTLYWIWPLRYENMVNDLYSPESAEYHDRFAPFLEHQSKIDDMKKITDNYRYSRIFLTNETGETVQDPSKAYNLADEYIGTKADFLYLTIQTSPAME